MRRLLFIVGLCCACGRTDLPQIAPTELKRFTPVVAESIAAAYRSAYADPKNAEAVGGYCMILHAHSQFNLALSCFRSAVRLAPARFRWNYYLAVAATEAGNDGAALDALQRSLSIRPDYVPAQLRRAEALLRTGRIAESITAFASLVRDHPRDAAAHYGLGRGLAARDDTSGAIAEFERACDLFPPYAAAHYAAAQAYRRAGNPEAAAHHSNLHRAARLMRPPQDDPLLDDILRLNRGAQVHIERSAALEAAGRLEEAVAETKEALRIEPSSVQAHVNLVSLYGRMQRSADAEAHYWKSVALDPSSADAHYNYGVLLLNNGRLAEAAKLFRRALEANPRHSDAHNNLGLVLDKTGDPAQALRHFLAALEATPSHRGARYHAGRMLIARGQAAEAVDHFRQALEPLDEGTTDVMYGLATAYIRSGDIRNGRKCVQKAYDLALRYGRQDLIGRLRRDLNTLSARGTR